MILFPNIRNSARLALLIVALCGFLRGESAPSSPAPSVVASVEGATIDAQELALFISWRKAEIAARLFPGEPAIDVTAWQRRIDKRSAAEILKAAALDDAIDAKLLQLLAIEHGLLTDASWRTFERTLADENARRADAVARGQPIYGPRVFQLPQFYRKRLNDLRLRLARKLSDTPQPDYERVAKLLASRRSTARVETNAQGIEALALE